MKYVPLVFFIPWLLVALGLIFDQQVNAFIGALFGGTMPQFWLCVFLFYVLVALGKSSGPK